MLLRRLFSQRGPAMILATLVCLRAYPETSAETPSWQERRWNRDLIYFVMTDRFLDGDRANNQPPGSDPALYDTSQADIRAKR